MNTLTLIQVSIYLFLFLFVLGLIKRDKDKKIEKAAEVLNIRPEFISQVKDKLLEIYVNHPYMIRESNENFYFKLTREQPFLLYSITNTLVKLNLLQDLSK